MTERLGSRHRTSRPPPVDRHALRESRAAQQQLSRLYRTGELTLIVVPDAGHEALRDLVRARRCAQRDVIRARHQLTQLLLRHGHRYRETRHWTQQHWVWIKRIELPHEDAQRVVEETQTMVKQRVEQLARYDELIEQTSKRPQYGPYVQALRPLHGIDTLTAMSILAELGDLRRFGTAPQLMAQSGLVPSEYSTGEHNHRFAITKTGNNHVRYLADAICVCMVSLSV